MTADLTGIQKVLISTISKRNISGTAQLLETPKQFPLNFDDGVSPKKFGTFLHGDIDYCIAFKVFCHEIEDVYDNVTVPEDPWG